MWEKIARRQDKLYIWSNAVTCEWTGDKLLPFDYLLHVVPDACTKGTKKKKSNEID